MAQSLLLLQCKHRLDNRHLQLQQNHYSAVLLMGFQGLGLIMIVTPVSLNYYV